MALWTGCTCSSCNKTVDGDDVVVCPQCGSPYHRECYEKAGKCVFTDKHGNGFEYKRPEQDIKKRCGNCGAENDSDATVCHKCGAALEQPESTVDSASTATEPPKPRYEPVGGPFSRARRRRLCSMCQKESTAYRGANGRNISEITRLYYLLRVQAKWISRTAKQLLLERPHFPRRCIFSTADGVEGILTAVLFMLLSVPSMLYTLLTVGISAARRDAFACDARNLSLI